MYLESHDAEVLVARNDLALAIAMIGPREPHTVFRRALSRAIARRAAHLRHDGISRPPPYDSR